jgi:hypothetical protein
MHGVYIFAHTMWLGRAGGCSLLYIFGWRPAGLVLLDLATLSASHFPDSGFLHTAHDSYTGRTAFGLATPPLHIFRTRLLHAHDSCIHGEEDYCVWLLAFSLDTFGSRGFDTIVCYICCTCTCTCTF